MFAKKARFSFKGALPKNVFRSPSFNLRHEKNEGVLKVAVVVSKKVDKRATVRNKIRRQILEKVQQKTKQSMPFNLVFYVRSASSKNLEEEIEEAINNLKV